MDLDGWLQMKFSFVFIIKLSYINGILSFSHLENGSGSGSGSSSGSDNTTHIPDVKLIKTPLSHTNIRIRIELNKVPCRLQQRKMKETKRKKKLINKINVQYVWIFLLASRMCTVYIFVF